MVVEDLLWIVPLLACVGFLIAIPFSLDGR